MKQQWQLYSERYQNITPREQYLILAVGFIAIILVIFSVFVDANMINTDKNNQEIKRLTQANNTTETTIKEFENALQGDLNKNLKTQIKEYEHKLSQVDQQLLALTSDLIDPVQMRNALIELLNMQKGVSLTSFELIGVEEVLSAKKVDEKSDDAKASQAGAEDVVNVLDEDTSISLYRHGIKIKLKGSYFQLRDYLSQLEQLSWKFFWQGFNYQVQEYPNSELEIEIYSLSTKKEFIGV
ncbi:hypothetical protein [Thalassotalea sp. PLHSN55]|uniref:hypothetical protein n=1 Tax=Thalassotalea sp. PLHSN55 TaxID=3435888 RepID=UPI003F8314F7